MSDLRIAYPYFTYRKHNGGKRQPSEKLHTGRAAVVWEVIGNSVIVGLSFTLEPDLLGTAPRPTPQPSARPPASVDLKDPVAKQAWLDSRPVRDRSRVSGFCKRVGRQIATSRLETAPIQLYRSDLSFMSNHDVLEWLQSGTGLQDLMAQAYDCGYAPRFISDIQFRTKDEVKQAQTQYEILEAMLYS